ncbi:MAG: hypothetical protein Q9214_001348 [Letrouitia sp. 1 TL-2023]
MSTQYDSIGANFEKISRMLSEQIEHSNADQLLLPHMTGARVLELACGLGRYARQCVDMGASHVVAVDISSGMIEAAKAASSSGKYKDKIHYVVADCQNPQILDEGTFDVVVAAWLLNYAPTREVMADMFRNAYGNLKKGGVFLGSTCVPTENPARFVMHRQRVRPKRKGIIWTVNTGEIENGIKIRVEALMQEEKDDVRFDCYHLRASVHHQAAKEGGFFSFEWMKPVMPDHIKGTDMEKELQSFVTTPEYGIFLATKA